MDSHRVNSELNQELHQLQAPTDFKKDKQAERLLEHQRL